MRYLALLIAVCLCGMLPGQTFRRFSATDGLATGGVFAVLKDHHGFLWVATSEVLQRYDGDRFVDVAQLVEPGDPIPVEVRSISLAPDSSIWTTSELGGLFRYDPRTGRSAHWNGYAGDTLDLSAGALSAPLWLHADSILAYHTTKGMLLLLPAQRTHRWLGQVVPGRPASARELAMDAGGVLVSTVRGLFRMDRKSFAITPVLQRGDLPRHAHARDVVVAPDGQYWLTTWGAGLVRYDPRTGARRYFLTDSLDPQPYVENIFGGLVRRADGSFWTGTQEGLLYLDPARGTQHLFVHVPTDPHSLAPGEIVELYSDPDSVLWVCTQSGLCMLDPGANRFRSWPVRNALRPGIAQPFVTGIAEVDGELYVGTDLGDGILRMDPRTGAIEAFPFGRSGADGAPLSTRDVLPLPDGSLFVPATTGNFILDPRTMDLRSLPGDGFAQYGEMAGLGILVDRAGGLWTGRSNKGVFRTDPRTGSVQAFTELKGTHWPQGIAEDQRGTVWVAAYTEGIAGRTLRNGMWTKVDRARLGIPHAMAVWDLDVDTEDRLWLATRGAGVVITPANDPGGAGTRSLLGHQGLPALVSSVYVDPQGDRVWLGGPRGLYSVDTRDLSVRHYGAEDGLDGIDMHHVDIRRHPSGLYTMPDIGRLWFFSREGLDDAPARPTLWIDRISMSGRRLPRAAWCTDALLELPHDSAQLAVDYSAVAFARRNEVHVEYRLAGRDEAWTTTGPKGTAVFTALKPGDYSFELRLAGQVDRVQRIPFRVKHAWWQRTWLHVSLALCVLVVGYALYRRRLRIVAREARMRSDFDQRLAEVELQALRAQMNPHFLFNSLNSINRYIVKSEPRLASEYLTKFSRLMRLVLNNSKQQLITLQEELDALALYIELEALRFSDRFASDTAVELDTDASTVRIPPMLIQPYVENAIWHGLMHKTDGAPRLTIAVRKLGAELRITVEDNGVGRAHSAMLRSKRATDGPRYGTAITRERLELMERKYGIRTTVVYTDLQDLALRPSGTRVVITITDEPTEDHRPFGGR